MTISISHSEVSPTRGWNYGLTDDDYTALVFCSRTGEKPIDWQADNLVQYIKVSDLRTAYKSNRVIIEKPKGSQEGFETRITWTYAVASSDGKVTNIDKNRIQFRRKTDSRIITLQLTRNSIHIEPIVTIGENIQKNKILTSVTKVSLAVPIKSIGRIFLCVPVQQQFCR